MRYLASEKIEIINLVEQSHLTARRTLDRLGIPRRTFYRRCDRYMGGVHYSLFKTRDVAAHNEVQS